MAYTEVLTSASIAASQWDEEIFAEYIGMMWWKNVMGTSQNAIIQIKEDLIKKPGDAITVNLRGLMVGGKVVGNATGVGNEGKVDFLVRESL